jgi:hypothetical protein
MSTGRTPMAARASRSLSACSCIATRSGVASGMQRRSYWRLRAARDSSCSHGRVGRSSCIRTSSIACRAPRFSPGAPAIPLYGSSSSLRDRRRRHRRPLRRARRRTRMRKGAAWRRCRNGLRRYADPNGVRRCGSSRSTRDDRRAARHCHMATTYSEYMYRYPMVGPKTRRDQVQCRVGEKLTVRGASKASHVTAGGGTAS